MPSAPAPLRSLRPAFRLGRATALATAALLTTGLAACGSEEDQARATGESIGDTIAQIQAAATPEAATRSVQGIDHQLEGLAHSLSTEDEEAIDGVIAKLDELLEESQKDAGNLAHTASEALAAFEAAGSDGALGALAEGVKQGFEEHSN